MSSRIKIAAATAASVLREFGVTSPDLINVEAFAISNGAFIEYVPLKGAAGRLVRDETTGIIRVDSGILDAGQRRFTAAHELGHFLLHEKDRNASCRPEDMLAWYKTSPIEHEANVFAAELLMPRELFNGSCDRSELNLASLEQLARAFRISLTATTIRYADIGPHVCALIQSHKGVIRWFHPAPDFPFRILGPGTLVQPDSGAHEFFSGRLTTPETEDVLADRWLEDERIESGWTIREITIPMPNYESALSMLWIVPKSPLDIAAAED